VSGKALAQSSVKLAAQTWLPVRACFRGNDLFLQVGSWCLFLVEIQP
jgi:hypothetical protein